MDQASVPTPLGSSLQVERSRRMSPPTNPNDLATLLATLTPSAPGRDASDALATLAGANPQVQLELAFLSDLTRLVLRPSNHRDPLTPMVVGAPTPLAALESDAVVAATET